MDDINNKNDLKVDNAIDAKFKSIVESIENLEVEKKEISKQISDIYKQAKTIGFKPQVVRRIISLRKMPTDKRVELEILLESYKQSLGMID